MTAALLKFPAGRISIAPGTGAACSSNTRRPGGTSGPKSRPRRNAAVARLRQLQPVACINIDGELTADRARRIRAEIRRAARPWVDVIRINIDSNGGDNDAVAGIVREMRAAGKPFHCHVERRCDSAACDILAEGSLRTAAPGARILLHVSAANLPPIQASRMTAFALRQLAAMMDGPDQGLLRQLRAIGCRIPPDMEKKYLKGKDVILSAQEAREIGLIHTLEAI